MTQTRHMHKRCLIKSERSAFILIVFDKTKLNGNLVNLIYVMVKNHNSFCWCFKREKLNSGTEKHIFTILKITLYSKIYYLDRQKILI